MASVLISGPAGASKSALAAKGCLQSIPALADHCRFPERFTAAITLVERDPSGRYPLRDARLLPIVEYVRRAMHNGRGRGGKGN